MYLGIHLTVLWTVVIEFQCWGELCNYRMTWFYRPGNRSWGNRAAKTAQLWGISGSVRIRNSYLPPAHLLYLPFQIVFVKADCPESPWYLQTNVCIGKGVHELEEQKCFLSFVFYVSPFPPPRDKIVSSWHTSTTSTVWHWRVKH